MRLNFVSANRHILDGQVNGKPVRLLLGFDDGRTLRLQITGDGEQMVLDDHPLDAPLDMGDYGLTDVADVTQSLFAGLRGVEVKTVQALAWKGRRVGLKLNLIDRQSFHF